MAKSLNEIRELINSGSGKSLISKAIKHQNRIRFHTDTNIDRFDAKAATDFLEWVKTLIPSEKYAIFVNLFQYPVMTIDLVSAIYTELQRVFTGRNRASTYEFTDNRLKDDWEYYRQEYLQEPKVWEFNGWDALKTSTNSILIVDLPEVQTDVYPQPYFYWLEIEHVIAFEFDRNEKRINWIAFKQDENRVAFFDDEAFYVLTVDAKGNYSLTSEKPHGLKYCPARFFWNDPLSSQTPEIKKAPISKQLAKLDWVLFFETSKHHLDLYGAYPIYSAYEQDCDFANPVTGDYCDGGFMRTSEGSYLFNGGAVTKCPVCEKSHLAGVGAVITVPQPTEGVDMRNPVTITTVDTASLQYNVTEVERLKKEIFQKCVGLANEFITEAINEKQVQAGFESKTAVLRSLKTDFEEAQLWVTETVCFLRYGEAFTGASISYGTEFYVYTVNELYEQYKLAKETGATDIILDGIQDRIIETENINNPVELQRTLIMKHLEPYRHLTKKEVVEMRGAGVIQSDEDVMIKVNFSTFVMRFERENVSIIEFGAALPFNKKIDIIYQTFKDYANESRNPGDGKGVKPSENGVEKPVPTGAEG